MNDCMYIVYASDDRFAEILGVSLTSLYENNKDMKQIHGDIYVLIVIYSFLSYYQLTLWFMITVSQEKAVII